MPKRARNIMDPAIVNLYRGKRLTDADIEELITSESESDGEYNDEIDDNDWIPNEPASDEELVDNVEINLSDDKDKMDDEESIQEVKEEPDWDATVNILGTEMTYTSKDCTSFGGQKIKGHWNAQKQTLHSPGNALESKQTSGRILI